MKQSVKTKLIVVFILIIAIPLTVLGSLTYRRTANVVYDGYVASNTELVNQVDYAVKNYMDGYRMTVEVFAASQTTRTVYENISSKKMMMEGFKNFLAENPDVLFLYMGTERGDMFDPSWEDVPDDYDPTSRPWYSVTKEQKQTTWTAPYEDADTGQMVVSVSAPVYNQARKFIGVVAMDISLSSLAEEMNGIQIGQTGYPVLLDSTDTVLTHKNPELIAEVFPITEMTEALAANPEGNVTYTDNGVEKFAIYGPIEGLDWTVLVIMDASEVDSQTRPILITTLVLTIICLAAGIFVALLQARILVKPIVTLEKTMNYVKEGDLSVRAEITSNDEIGKMAGNFNVMMDHFAEMLSKSKNVAQQVSISAEDLAASAEEVSASSDEVSRTIDEIAHGATEQAGETEQAAVLMNGLADKLQVLTSDSEKMSSAAKNVEEANYRGTEVMTELKTKTTENNDATARIAKAVQELESKSAEIGGILETITAIADQTNLLALNASIEAARAGEHGRGFAVVAEEIRKLAEGSGEAAENIRVIVSQIQENSKTTVSIMSEVKNRTEEQGVAVSSVDEVFVQINKATAQITSVIDEVAKFIDDVNIDKDKIVASIENISAVSEESAAASQQMTASVQQETAAIEEVAKAAELLNSMADDLQREINVFKI
jgi:methyl-accepting chemotaxis protein